MTCVERKLIAAGPGRAGRPATLNGLQERPNSFAMHCRSTPSTKRTAGSPGRDATKSRHLLAPLVEFDRTPFHPRTGNRLPRRTGWLDDGTNEGAVDDWEDIDRAFVDLRILPHVEARQSQAWRLAARLLRCQRSSEPDCANHTADDVLLAFALSCARTSKNRAWLMTALTVSGRNGLVMRNVGSGRVPVRTSSG